MPKRTDIQSVLVIGSGPIVIGQAAEFDYSGTQACRVLKAEGLRVILVNSNPATIMTDPEIADATYVEPITPDFVEKIIAKERPRRAAAHPRRPDGAQHRDLPARGGHPGRPRCRADRRQRRGHQQGRGPRPVQGGRRGRPRQDRARRVRALLHLPLDGRRAERRRGARRLPGRRTPLLHHGRRRLRLRPRRGGTAPHRRAGPDPLAHHRGAPGGPSSAGRSTSWS